MNVIKNFSLAITLILFYNCSISDKHIEKFANKVTKDFINKDSISLYNKIMDGETAGEWGFLFYVGNNDFSLPNGKIISPKELVELSKQRHMDSKKNSLKELGRIATKFNNSFDSKIVSIKIDTLYIYEEGEAANLINKSKKHYTFYNIRQIIKTEKGDSIYFRPGFIMKFGNKLYLHRPQVRFSDEKFTK
jgi:hypothetical protein